MSNGCSPVLCHSAKNAALLEPRIDLIRRQINSLLSVIDFEKDGQVVAVDSFRLKNLRDWIVPSSGSPLEVFGYAGSHCNMDCVFCYHKGDPPSLALADDDRPLAETHREMETRLKYFSPEGKSALFSSLGNIYEVLAHRNIMDVLTALRQKTQRSFRITTNGRCLTPSMIEALAGLQPVYLHLSLHSATAARRKQLLRDRRPDVAIAALPLLQAAGVPYAVVIVPWPVPSLEAMIDDLAETVADADGHDPHLIEVHLPGHARSFSEDKLYDREETWSAIVNRVRKLREKVATPIVVMPSMYEENLCEKRSNLPAITGLVKNSPAARAGLARGDLLVGIGGLAVSWRPQARDLLSRAAKSGVDSLTLSVRRSGRTLTLDLAPKDYGYPYTAETNSHLGIVMMGTGLRPSALERLKEVIDEHKARRVLLLTSTLMQPGVRQSLRESPLFAAPDLTIELAVPQNRFFGGDIIMGDLLVVQDFIDCVEDYLSAGNARPDLVIVPSSPFNLGRFKRDLTGRVYLDIERQVGVPVALLDCETIYD